MDHIPVEVLHQIFIRLDLNDRLSCTLVRRSWYNVLNQRSLLYSLHIPGSMYPKFKDMAERLPYQAAQVEYLRLTNCFNPNFDKRKLCNMFPNLRELILEGFSDDKDVQEYISNPFQFLNPTSKLELLADVGECELTRQLCISNLCNRLKTLTLDLNNFVNTSDSQPMSTTVLSQLKNMPVLETLFLCFFDIKLTDLETMHSNLPSIKYLKFENTGLYPGEFPQDIIPATLITKLEAHVDYIHGDPTHIYIYKYFSKKYPSVSHFHLFDEVLKILNTDNKKQVYEKGIFSFLQTIGSQVDAFSFDDYCNGLDAFKKFDGYGIKLKAHSIESSCDDTLFLEELVQSQQPKYIQHLELRDIVPKPMNMMSSMEALTTLTIDCNEYAECSRNRTRKSIDFSQFIEACPATLVTLITRNIDLTFDTITSATTNITSLSVCQLELTPSLVKAIETSFPDLLQLQLYGLMKSNLTISLPNHHFYLVNILTVHENGQRNGFLIKTTCNDWYQHYSPRQTQVLGADGQAEMGIIVYPVTKEELDDPLVLNFTCASIVGQRLQLQTLIHPPETQ